MVEASYAGDNGVDGGIAEGMILVRAVEWALIDAEDLIPIWTRGPRMRSRSQLIKGLETPMHPLIA